MRDKNKCDPQLGQRRPPIGGNGDGSGRFGCGIGALPNWYRREHLRSLSHRRLRRGPWSVMLHTHVRIIARVNPTRSQALSNQRRSLRRSMQQFEQMFASEHNLRRILSCGGFAHTSFLVGRFGNFADVFVLNLRLFATIPHTPRNGRE